MNAQLDALEQRLLDAEQKRKPYMTISELKTAVYQMRETLIKGGKPITAQIKELQDKIEHQQPVSETEIKAMNQRLEALNSQLTILIMNRNK